MHYYKRNLGDYAIKTGRLSLLQHGAYTLLIDACYNREKFPTLEDAFDWLLPIDKDEESAIEFVLKRFFTLDGDIYVQTRIKEEIDAYHEKALKNQQIAIAREENRRKKSTNREPNVNDNSQEREPNQEPRTKNHKPRTIKKTIKAKHDFSTFSEEPSEQVFQDWLAMRNKKKHSTSKTVLNSLGKKFTELKALGYSVDECFSIWLEKGWQGFEVDWIVSLKQSGIASSARNETVVEEAVRLRKERLSGAK